MEENEEANKAEDSIGPYKKEIRFYHSFEEAFEGLTVIRSEDPSDKLKAPYSEAYQNWLTQLKSKI